MAGNNEMPPGLHFNASDTVLVNYYLRNKANPPAQEALPDDGIPVRGIFVEDNPWDVFPDDTPWVPVQLAKYPNKYVTYAYTQPERHDIFGRIRRRVGSGTWKMTDRVRQITMQGQVIGSKRTYCFQLDQPGPVDYQRIGYWTLHQYALREGVVDQTHWFLCKIFRDDTRTSAGTLVGEPPQQ